MAFRPGTKMPAGRNYQGNRFGTVPKKKGRPKGKKKGFVPFGKKKAGGKAPVPPEAFGLAAAMKMAGK